MSELKIGSLFSGYGGLDIAVESVTGARTAWVSDIDKGACKILAHRYPDVPNIDDVSTVDWSQLESIDILTGGYPCQPFSLSGDRKGTNDARHLWPYVREAIRHLRPRLTVLENVPGHRSLGFDRVLGDMAEDGMHVRWTSVRASDVAAPHRRERLFIVVEDPDRPVGGEWRQPTPGQAQGGRAWPDAGRRGGAPSAHTCGIGGDQAVKRDGGRQASGDRSGVLDECDRDDVRVGPVGIDWGIYGPAIRRWESRTGRPAPDPHRTHGEGQRVSPELALH